LTKSFQTLIVLAAWGMLPAATWAGDGMEHWYFPKPYTMSSPMFPSRFGGMELSMNFAGSGMGFAFPLQSTMTAAERQFAIDFAWPLGVGAPDGGQAKFYGGNPRLGFLGSWKFSIPFSADDSIPAAWSVGADICIPLAAIWGGNVGFGYNYPIYLQDYAAWRPDFAIKPKAMLALGQPLFFAEFELDFPGLLVGIRSAPRGSLDVLLGWGLTLGTQPLDWFSMMFELGGLHDLRNRTFADHDPIWGAVSLRLTFGSFATGLSMRIPFVRAYTSEIEAPVMLSLFFGYEIRISR
jgi:hypothetical protein